MRTHSAGNAAAYANAMRTVYGSSNALYLYLYLSKIKNACHGAVL